MEKLIVGCRPKWLTRFYDMAVLVSSWSKDSRKVGAVVFKENRVLGIGYNGYPKGVSQFEDTKEVKRAKTIDAEMNAIMSCKQDLQDASIMVTHHPCSKCATVIIQVGITNVYCKKPIGEMKSWEESFRIAKEMFYDANVNFVILD